jgi:hypothetical protein
MTAPPRRRALPAVMFIGVLVVLTAIVWVRVLDRSANADTSSPSTCITPSPPAPTVLPKPAVVAVIVLNSTERERLAAHTATAIHAQGFRVAQTGNDEPSYGGHGVLPGIAEIRYGPAATASATLLHYYLPGARMVPTDSSAGTVILALGEKYQRLLTAQQVQQTLTQRHIRLTPTTPPPVPAPTPTC